MPRSCDDGLGLTCYTSRALLDSAAAGWVPFPDSLPCLIAARSLGHHLSRVVLDNIS